MTAAAQGGAYTTDTLLASGAKTASANTASIDGYGFAHHLIVQVACTASAGTGSPTLDVKIQDTVDGGTNWRDIITFTQVTGTTVEQKVLSTAFADSIRVSYVIAGTNPSFTFSVKAFAKV